MQNLTINELQSLARAGDDDAIRELGEKVMNFDFCLTNGDLHCEYELHKLLTALDNEPFDDCPFCGKPVSKT